MQRGTIHLFNKFKGFGFVKINDQDIFVHKENIQEGSTDQLVFGREIEFDIVETDVGSVAKNIRIL